MVTELKECRICKSKDLKRVLDLGEIYPSAFLSEDEKVSDDMKAPLKVCQCKDCGLVQLEHTIDLDLMYRQYWYSSSLNKSMVYSLKEIVSDLENKIQLDDDDTVIDIGCNDGTMLQLYSKNIFKVGFDPALNLNKPECFFINDYFSYDKYTEKVKTKNLKAKVVTAIAMFYDLPDPNKFVSDVVKVLDKDGIFVVQFTDLLSMFKLTAFDNICHEHLEYYSLKVVKNLLEANGLKVIDVSYNDVNGGSIRITSAHKDCYKYNVSERVEIYLEEEENYFSSEDHSFSSFAKRIERGKEKMRGFLKWAKEQRKTVFLMGASTKGNTLLQVYGITKEDVPYAAEVNAEKFGLRTAGSDIKIISEDSALIKHPDYMIVPVWHFITSLRNKEKIKDYLASGGHLVVPLPEFEVFNENGGVKI
jgi:hypothetical protein